MYMKITLKRVSYKIIDVDDEIINDFKKTAMEEAMNNNDEDEDISLVYKDILDELVGDYIFDSENYQTLLDNAFLLDGETDWWFTYNE